MSLRGPLLRRAPIQRQARLFLQLPGDGRAGNPPKQPRGGRREDPEDMKAPRCYAPVQHRANAPRTILVVPQQTTCARSLLVLRVRGLANLYSLTRRDRPLSLHKDFYSLLALSLLSIQTLLDDLIPKSIL